MRAVLTGMLGAVLAAASTLALANEPTCQATRAVVKAVSDAESVYNPDKAPPARPDLVGKEFRITRLTQIDRFIRLEPGDYKRNAGHETVELTGKAGRLILRADYLPRTTPAIGYSSYPGSAPKAPKFDGKPDRKTKVRVGEQYAHHITSGPLANMSLDVTACR
jgi:hypothetical protein